MTAIDVGGRRIEVSHPDKVFYPDDGITKGDVVDYYRRVADLMIPHLRDRPLALRRHPDGLHGGGFFQKQVPEHFPDWIETVTLEKREGGTTTYVVCDDAATLVYLADQATLVPHVLLAPSDHPEHPDQLVFDLDPPDDGDRHLDAVRVGADLLREVLTVSGLTPYVKSSGSRGLHVHVALDGRDRFDTARAFATDAAREVAGREPEMLTVEQRKDRRGDRVFIDVGRNAYGQHAVAPYALRAKPGAPVAVPLDWHEATGRDFHPRQYTLSNVFRRLARTRDPWSGVTSPGGSASAARERLAGEHGAR